MPAQIKPKSFESRQNSFSSFLPGVDASHVYVRASALGCFYSLISTQTFWRVLTASVDSCSEIKICSVHCFSPLFQSTDLSTASVA